MKAIANNCLADQLNIGQDVGVITRLRQGGINSAYQSKIKKISSKTKQITTECGLRFDCNGRELGEPITRHYITILDDAILDAITQTEHKKQKRAERAASGQKRREAWETKAVDVEQRARLVVEACVPKLDEVLQALQIELEPEESESLKNALEHEIFQVLKEKLY